MIEAAAGGELTLTDYPRSGDFILDLIDEMKSKIASYTTK